MFNVILKEKMVNRKVNSMKYSGSTEQKKRTFPTVAEIMEEFEKDLHSKDVGKTVIASGEKVILEILERAADDNRFLARLAEDPGKVLKEYNLTMEQKAALASGDIRRIESWVGKLDKRMRTWITCRTQQEKW